MRMKRNELPQIAPNASNSSGVRQSRPATCGMGSTVVVACAIAGASFVSDTILA